MADDNIMIKRFFTYSELCLHNNVDDLWVAFLGRVYDLTPLSSEYRDDILMRPILSSSGTDISHWFEKVSRDACIEETISEIAVRYLKFNKHGFSYTWKFKGKYLDMYKTLEENGIVDEDEQHCDLRLDESHYLPQIQIYYNDDLTD
eukprot:TRINITY_DN244_c0_g1_i3.p1 TRINITY_DN244_c0_g1~~TRINITY_DN244_c0_g1_i3.p1  ORF type:complete len:147 (+),score=8.22 TRINITY_DN244_c0_g1_i3:90-530(+)